nr:coatomer subunit beta'-2 isoform X1 [Ipomoea batatas]
MSSLLSHFLCRGSLPPASEYVNQADRSTINLVEAFRNMRMDEEQPLQNGDLDHENGNEVQDDAQEETVLVDADSVDGAVLINGNGTEEQWDMNNEGEELA